MRYEIKELGIGGVLDQGINVTKNHFVQFLMVLLVLYIPFTLIVGVLQMSLAPPPPPLGATVEQNVFDAFFEVWLNVVVDFKLPRVDDAHVQAGVYRVIKER